VLVLLCLLLGFSAAAASIADALDGNDELVIGVAGGEPPVLPLRLNSSLPPPSAMERIHAPDAAARAAHASVPSPACLRAPPPADAA
jgi:hypothetical protein